MRHNRDERLWRRIGRAGRAIGGAGTFSGLAPAAGRRYPAPRGDPGLGLRAAFVMINDRTREMRIAPDATCLRAWFGDLVGFAAHVSDRREGDPVRRPVAGADVELWMSDAVSGTRVLGRGQTKADGWIDGDMAVRPAGLRPPPRATFWIVVGAGRVKTGTLCLDYAGPRRPGIGPVPGPGPVPINGTGASPAASRPGSLLGQVPRTWW